jgi:dihydropyrimidinase
LLLDESCYQDADPQNSLKYVCAPPLRQVKDQQALWMRLQSGEVQTVGTDHCAFNLHGQKDRGLNSFVDCPGGMPGIEARLSLIYTYGVRAGLITLQQWVNSCSTAPAQIFGLYPRKGSLMVGADADLVVFDPAREVRLTQSILHERVDYTPYEGFFFQGWPIAVFLSGNLISSISPTPLAMISAPSGKFIAAHPD